MRTKQSIKADTLHMLHHIGLKRKNNKKNNFDKNSVTCVTSVLNRLKKVPIRIRNKDFRVLHSVTSV